VRYDLASIAPVNLRREKKMTTLVLNVEPLAVTSDEFYQLCQANQDLRLERTAKGELVIMPPAGSETGLRNANVSGQLWFWNEHTRLGETFDSSAGFHLPNGADRSPDAAWIKRERWQALTPAERRGFAPICPDFVVELRSPTDKLQDIQAKMQEYIDNGAQLGWLIDPELRRVEIYEPGEEVEVLLSPDFVSGEPLLPGFRLELRRIFGD
jgi:Uma2 family endonuclease